jgi:hypothetical protein
MAEILLMFVLDTIQSINHYSDGFISIFCFLQVTENQQRLQRQSK